MDFIEFWRVLCQMLCNLWFSIPSLLYFGPMRLCTWIWYSIYAQYILPSAFDKDVVVCVHGRGGHPMGFDTFLKKLSDNNREKYIVFNVRLYNTRNTTIAQDAVELSRLLHSLKECRITLIGQSKGGAVVCHYLATFNDPRIVKVITVVAPLFGTKLADYAPFGTVKYNLNYNNTDLLNMSDTLKSHSEILHHVVHHNDHVIIPPSTSHYPHTPDENVYHYHGRYMHPFILESPDVINTINTWLEQS